MNNYIKPFDERLQYLVISEKNNTTEYESRMPFDGARDTDVYTFLMPISTLEENLKSKKELQDDSGNLKYDAVIEGSKVTVRELIDKQKKHIESNAKNTINMTQYSIMNPYAMIHLSGGIDSGGSNRLIDDANRAPWYETVMGEDSISKNPTTETIINWGKKDPKGRLPYLFQDFVFCKWWNKIPNNRLLTLRRYSNPILDNLNTPIDQTASETDNVMFPPIVTAVTYFGEDTGNNLKDILKFSTGVPWGEAKAEVWDLTSTGQPSTNEAYEGALGGLGIGFGSHLAILSNAMGVLSGNGVGDGLLEKNGLPPDPYIDGPYTNRIQGIVNRIDSVKKRDAGINFEMSGIKLKFNYIARPIGGINSKAIMLDILANFLTMGSPTAQFFGGAHRSRIAGRRFPAQNDKALQALYNGNLFGEGGAIDAYGERLSSFITQAGGLEGMLETIWDAAKGLLGDLIGSITGKKIGNIDLSSNTTGGKTAKEGVKEAITQKMRGGMPVSYIQGMRALLTGEPVGDWHLTIGNPMNPIAMIGNLICTNIEVEIDEDAGLGPDDFPLGWTITITLDHGMKRDRDAIESMFNFGNGRIYELPDKFGSSADDQTKVDDQTQTHSNDVINQTSQVKTPQSPKGRVIDNPMSGKPEHRKRINMSSGIFGKLDLDIKDEILNRLPAIYIDDLTTKKANR